jgi:hypothetical protein
VSGKKDILKKMKAAKGKRVRLKFKDGAELKCRLLDVYESPVLLRWVALVENGPQLQVIDIYEKIEDVTGINSRK